MRTFLVCLAFAAATATGCGDDDDDATGGDAGLDAAVGDDGGGEGEDAGTDGGSGGTLTWSACGGGLDCATLDVPVDHDAPEGATLTLSLLRLASVIPENRRGVLLFNNGGPGAPAVRMARTLFPSLANAAPDFAAQFDLVAVDPRGIDESAPIDCVDDDALSALTALDLSPDDEAEWTAVEGWIQAFADGCTARSGDLVAWVDTVATARDMDLVRAALGEEQLNYLGISYGTVLGATYATLFPERVRAFVLDSPVAPATDLVEYQGRQVDAYEVELGRFLADCGEDVLCTFHGGEGADALGAAWDAMVAALESTPIPAGADELSQALFLGGASALLRTGDWTGLAAGLRDAEAGDGTALRAAGLSFFGGQPDGTWTNFFEALVPILLLDVPCPDGYDAEAVRSDGAAAAARAPRIGHFAAGLVAYCPVWSVARTTPRVPIDAAAAPPMLVMAGLHDPATPYANAAPFLDALGNGSTLVTWEGNGHGVAARNLCTLAATLGFFRDPSTPPAATRCTP